MNNMLQDAEIIARANRAVQAASGEDRRVASIQEWGGGGHNRGYRLHLDDGSQLFWKVEKEQIFPRTRQGQVEREVTGIRLAAQAGVDCPRILGYDTTGNIAGCRSILEEFIDCDLLGEVMPTLGATEQAALLAEFQARADTLASIQGECFGEVTASGPLGQHATWPGMMAALSTLLIEDAETLGCFNAGEMAIIRRAHEDALELFGYGGIPTFNHLDLHIFNAFAVRRNGAIEMGKMFDFGFCLFLPPYVTRYNEKAFDGQEARLAVEYGVRESELHAFQVIFALEFVNFISAMRWAPDKPYGYVARQKDYLALCTEAVSTL